MGRQVMHDFLQLAGKTVLVTGLANKRSIAYFVGRTLQQAGAQVRYVVRSPQRKETVAGLVGDAPVHVCDVEYPEQIAGLAEALKQEGVRLAGLVHAIAFADYSGGVRPFHETPKAAFLQAMDISCYSLIALAGALKELLAEDASVVTLSISTTRMASESYGYMAPVKAALDSAVAFLAKSFSRFSRVRFNAVASGLLKTSASAGIPGYLDAYLYAEQVIPRKQALTTQEVADVAVFLLSPRSSGINAQSVVVDAGMSINYFDTEIVRRFFAGEGPPPSRPREDAS
jgi:enoyl-[acyl-carrier protein] reductase I